MCALTQPLPQAKHQAEASIHVSQLGRLQPTREVAERHLWIDHPDLVQQHPRALPAQLDHGSPRCTAEGSRCGGHQDGGDVHQIGLDRDREPLPLLLVTASIAGSPESVEITMH